jgi:hypothetical protein
MDFLTFCQQIVIQKKIPDTKVSFIGVSEPLALEYRALCKPFFVKHRIDFGQVLTFTAETIGLHIATLSMSFLGTAKTYWILGIDSATPLAQKKWLETLASIESPHHIFVIHNEKKIQVGTPVLLKNSMVQREAEVLACIFTGKTIQHIKPFFAALEATANRISPATLQALLEYSHVVGTKSKDFFTQWMPILFTPEQSLFELADAFFSGNTEQFISLFHALSTQYPIAFWCTFFSEQLFKAALVVCAKANGKPSSPEIEYRLPFNFLKKYWKLHTFDKLVAAHETITKFDIAFKKGDAREKKLELLLIAYLERQ